MKFSYSIKGKDKKVTTTTFDVEDQKEANIYLRQLIEEGQNIIAASTQENAPNSKPVVATKEELQRMKAHFGPHTKNQKRI